MFELKSFDARTLLSHEGGFYGVHVKPSIISYSCVENELLCNSGFRRERNNLVLLRQSNLKINFGLAQLPSNLQRENAGSNS